MAVDFDTFFVAVGLVCHFENIVEFYRKVKYCSAFYTVGGKNKHDDARDNPATQISAISYPYHRLTRQ